VPKSGREQVFSSQLSLTAYGMFVTTSFGICAKSHIIDLLVNADFLQRMKFQQFYAIQVNAFAIFRSAWVQNAAFPIPVGNMRRRFTYSPFTASCVRPFYAYNSRYVTSG